jgi:hypothetical protein
LKLQRLACKSQKRVAHDAAGVAQGVHANCLHALYLLSSHEHAEPGVREPDRALLVRFAFKNTVREDYAVLLRGVARRAFMVRGTQLLPHTRYSDSEARAYLSLGAHAEQRLALAVIAGGTLEVTLAQFWSSLGPGRIRVEVPLRSISPAIVIPKLQLLFRLLRETSLTLSFLMLSNIHLLSPRPITWLLCRLHSQNMPLRSAQHACRLPVQALDCLSVSTSHTLAD